VISGAAVVAQREAQTAPPGTRVISATTPTPPGSAEASRKVIFSPVAVLVTVRLGMLTAHPKTSDKS
jgi:hypothetical protein